jgi:hypothetical protein
MFRSQRKPAASITRGGRRGINLGVPGRAFNQIFDPARLAKSDAPADRGGRAPRSGRGGRRFKSCHSDQLSQDIQSLRGPICGTKPVQSQAHLDLRLAPTRVDQRCMRFSALPRNSLGGHPSARRRTRHFGDRKGASATRELAPASRYRGSAAAGGCTIIAGPSSEFQRRSQVCRGYGRQWSRCLHRLRNRLPDRRWGRRSKRRSASCRRAGRRRPVAPIERLAREARVRGLVRLAIRDNIAGGAGDGRGLRLHFSPDLNPRGRGRSHQPDRRLRGNSIPGRDHITGKRVMASCVVDLRG